MKRVLKLAKLLSLPISAVTQTFLILAKRGVGKTYTAAVMAEQMLKAGLQVVIVDPIGVWWGLRADADGKREGLPIVIFGGDHADVPLEATAGEVIADLIVNSALSAVLDLSNFRKGEQVRFMTAFSERLYQRNRAPLHLMLDEADAFAPQKPQHGDERMLGALEDIIRRGRARGLGATLITQRSAVLNKNVLTQAEVLIALRTIAPQDRDAIEAWIEVHGDEKKRKEMMSSLASLDIGEAWFWSPGWLEKFQRIRINRRETFDSSATPEVGTKMRKPKKLARVDLEKIRTRIADTIERAKKDDPRELRKRIGELEQIARRRPEAPKSVPPKEAKPIIQRIPVLGKAGLRKIARLRGLLDSVGTELAKTTKVLAEAVEKLQEPKAAPQSAAPLSRGTPLPPLKGDRRAAPSDEKPTLRRGERNMLRVLFQVAPTMLTRTQLGTLAGYAVSGGSFDTYIGTLRRAALIVEQGDLIGVDPSRDPEGLSGAEPLTRASVLAMWMHRLRRGERTMLGELLSHPEGLTKEDLGEKSGYSVTGGSFDTYTGTLTRNGLAEKRGGIIKISETLFLGAVKP